MSKYLRVTHNHWQFSLRTLLLVMFAVAALLAVSRFVGFDWMVWVWFALLLLAPATMRSRSSMGAWFGALAAVFGPFVVMAIYTLVYVSCSHCKMTTWSVLPYGPGIVPVELVRRWLDLDRPDDVKSFAISFVVTALQVIGLALVSSTRGRWWQGIAVVGVATLSSFGAFVVLALIRA